MEMIHIYLQNSCHFKYLSVLSEICKFYELLVGNLSSLFHNLIWTKILICVLVGKIIENNRLIELKLNDLKNEMKIKQTKNS